MDKDKTKFIWFKQDGAISTLNSKPLKLVEKFTYFDSNSSSTESGVNKRRGNKRTTICRLLIIWECDLSDKIKLEFF